MLLGRAQGAAELAPSSSTRPSSAGPARRVSTSPVDARTRSTARPPRLNYLTPTIKPIGYASSADGRRRRVYDAPYAPVQRLLAAGTLSPAPQAELTACRDSLNPAQLARQIADLQNRLLLLAKENPDSSTSRACQPPCPSSARAPGSKPSEPRPISRAKLSEAVINFRGHLDQRHHGNHRARDSEMSPDSVRRPGATRMG